MGPCKIGAAWLNRDHGQLAASERVHADSLKLPIRRAEYIGARLLSRRLLAAELGCSPAELVFTRDEHGRPRLADMGADLHFSLSHGGGWMACAVLAGALVGIDVEAADRRANALAIARHAFHRSEAEQLAALPLAEQHAAFIRLWTLKEAALKAVGLGISQGLRRPHFQLQPQLRALSTPPAAPAEINWYYHHCSLQTADQAGWQLALASTTPASVKLTVTDEQLETIQLAQLTQASKTTVYLSDIKIN